MNRCHGITLPRPQIETQPHSERMRVLLRQRIHDAGAHFDQPYAGGVQIPRMSIEWEVSG